jgi:hypothetical protein
VCLCAVQVHFRSQLQECTVRQGNHFSGVISKKVKSIYLTAFYYRYSAMFCVSYIQPDLPKQRSEYRHILLPHPAKRAWHEYTMGRMRLSIRLHVHYQITKHISIKSRNGIYTKTWRNNFFWCIGLSVHSNSMIISHEIHLAIFITLPRNTSRPLPFRLLSFLHMESTYYGVNTPVC